MSRKIKLDRRRFLQVGAAAGGGLLIGLPLPLIDQASGQLLSDDFDVNTWITVGGDNTIRVRLAHSEMGQGTHTGLAMLVAEEAGFDWRRIRGYMPPADPSLANKAFGVQGTGGSTSLRFSFDHLRYAGAVIRRLLMMAASQRWGCPLEHIEFRDEFLVHVATGHYINFGGLAEAASRLPVPQDIVLKEPSEWRFIGRSMPRLDVPQKTNGKAQYGIDVSVDDMLIGVVASSPVFGGKLISVDPAPAKAVKGVKEVIGLDDAVIVIADGFWPAQKGLRALSPKWWDGPQSARDNNSISRDLQDGLESTGAVAEEKGNPGDAMAAAAQVMELDYSTPYLAHATMEPMNATARMTYGGGVEIWAPTQNQHNAQMTAARILGIEPSKVILHTPYLGGGFGRRIESDYVAHAVHAARAMGVPVKVIWPREQDMTHDHYRPASMARFKIGIDEQGRPAALDLVQAGPSIMATRRPEWMKDGVDPAAVEGLVHMPYTIANRRISYSRCDLGVPVGLWRSVAHSHNGFYLESAIDELAHRAGRDPLDYRADLLTQSPRHLLVLERLRDKSGWSGTLPEGHVLGAAIHESYGSIVGEAVELSLEDEKRLRLHRITCVIDCGRAIHPDAVRAQMEGGIIFGLSAALYGKIDIRGGRARQQNFDRYKMMTVDQTPPIDVHIVESGADIGGVGEPGTPPAAPALTNAIFAASGIRIRKLPIAEHGFSLA